jgi:hypothetical protein
MTASREDIEAIEVVVESILDGVFARVMTSEPAR